LPDDYIASVERDARRYQGQWTGSAGSLAAHCMRLLKERKRMLESTRDDLTPLGSADTARDAWARYHQQARPAGGDTPSSAEQLLNTARETVRARRQTYGPCTEHFARTVGAINAIFAHKLREPFTAAEWAQVMILDKLAREQERSHPDNPVDSAGYAACWHEAAGR